MRTDVRAGVRTRRLATIGETQRRHRPERAATQAHTLQHASGGPRQRGFPARNPQTHTESELGMPPSRDEADVANRRGGGSLEKAAGAYIPTSPTLAGTRHKRRCVCRASIHVIRTVRSTTRLMQGVVALQENRTYADCTSPSIGAQVCSISGSHGGYTPNRRLHIRGPKKPKPEESAELTTKSGDAAPLP